MKIAPGNIVHHELIGLEVEVVNGPHEGYVGMAGRVVDETMKMIFIETARGVKAVPKDGVTFIFTLPSGERVEVEGWVIKGRPEDRIKRRARKPGWGIKLKQ